MRGDPDEAGMGFFPLVAAGLAQHTDLTCLSVISHRTEVERNGRAL